MGRIETYRDLMVWQRGVDLAEEVYRLTRGYPREELFGLTAQTRRAAVSIPANIAEGYGRNTRASYVNFLRVAQGSLRELETHMIIAQRIGLVEQSLFADRLTLSDEVGRMLHGLIRKLAKAESVT